MRPIVVAALIAALLGAVERHAASVERALSVQDAANPTNP
jgi:hypothetical protein